jgi:hypothetical protein
VTPRALKQVATGGLSLWTWLVRFTLQSVLPIIAHAASAAALLSIVSERRRQFIVSHLGQQSHELRRVSQIILPRSDTHEEAGEHRLADIHRVELPT